MAPAISQIRVSPLQGEARISWAAGQMPVLGQIRERFASERPLEGVRIAVCLHVTAETANLMRCLGDGGAQASLCAANPLSTQDDVAAALAEEIEVHALFGEDLDTYARHVGALVAGRPQVTIDDGADLLTVMHAAGDEALDGRDRRNGGDHHRPAAPSHARRRRAGCAAR